MEGKFVMDSILLTSIHILLRSASLSRTGSLENFQAGDAGERYLVEFEEEAAEKMRQRLANSQAELANSQAETAAANELLASLEEQLWRAKSQEESERLRAELGNRARGIPRNS